MSAFVVRFDFQRIMFWEDGILAGCHPGHQKPPKHPFLVGIFINWFDFQWFMLFAVVGGWHPGRMRVLTADACLHASY